MTSSVQVKKILLASILFLLIGASSYKLASNELVHCYLVRWSTLENIGPNLYVDPDMPDSQRQLLLSSINTSKKRISTLYGGFTATPIIIAGYTMEVMEFYGGNSYNRAGRTHITPVATFIILGPDGVVSVDVLAHELAHAEFTERIGYWNRNKFPNWLDEGLAVQFDCRYSDVEWRAMTDNGRLAPDLDQIGTIKHDDWLGYATAKHEVRRWLDVVGQEGFLELLQSIQSEDEFRETYQSIEQAYTSSH